MRDLPVPPAVLAAHSIMLGKTGAGKSSVLRLIVEYLLDRDMPVCILDPKGDWWGLKSSATGKSAGFPIVIFGGDHADVPINEHSGAAVAELVATGNRPSLIDLGGWTVGARTRFFIDFASSFFRNARGARHLVIDECHNVAPQGKVLNPQAGEMLHWANRLASEGRGKGITLLAASQRPQKVHKDFVTSCETLFAMRVIHNLDRAAIEDWMLGAGDKAVAKEIVGQLAGMPRGTAWIWSPEIGFGPIPVKFPLFRTFDSFKPQAAHVELDGWAKVDLEEVRGKLAAVVAEVEANDPKKLKAKVRELEQRVAKLGNQVVKSEPDEEALKQEFRRGFEAGEVHGRGAVRQKIEGAMEDVLARANTSLGTMMKDAITDACTTGAPTYEGRALPSRQKEAVRKSIPAKRDLDRDIDRQINGAPMGKGERATLIAMAPYPGGVTRDELSVYTGYARSTRDTYVQRLGARGYVEVCVNGMVAATPSGIAYLGDDYEPLPTGDALLKHWLKELPEGEKRVLDLVCQHGSDGLTREYLGDATGYARSTRDTYIQRLGYRRLVKVERGVVIPTAELFDG